MTIAQSQMSAMVLGTEETVIGELDVELSSEAQISAKN